MSDDSEVLNGLVFTRVDPSVIVHGGFGHITNVVASAHIQTKVYVSAFMIQVQVEFKCILGIISSILFYLEIEISITTTYDCKAAPPPSESAACVLLMISFCDINTFLWTDVSRGGQTSQVATGARPNRPGNSWSRVSVCFTWTVFYGRLS